MSAATALLVILTTTTWYIASSNAQNCSLKEVCEGQDAGTVVHGSKVEDILANAYSDFCGCQYISKNVHLDFSAVGVVDVSFVEANFSYFHDIKEITGYVFLSVPPVDQLSFPKLRVIRGEESIPGASGIALAVSGKIQSLYLPLLTEISAGGVYFTDEGDPTALCNVKDGSDASGYGVHWNDILNDDNSMKVFQITGCTGSDFVNCSKCDSGHCWCDGDVTSCCQTLTDTECGSCSNRCFVDTSTYCCDSECSAGCSGGESDNCYACKNFNNEGNCVENCPSQKYIVDSSQQVHLNPAYRVSLDNQCYKSCPEGYVEFASQCVTSCPHGFQSKGSICEQCMGLCDKECDGRIVTNETSDINDLFECTVIEGNLQINKLPPTWSPDDLNVLNSIREIQGALRIESWDEATFPYLSSLQYIGCSNSTMLEVIASTVLSDNGCDLPNHTVAVLIHGNLQLTSLDLPALKQICGGSVIMFNNPNLCYVGNFDTYFTDSSQVTCRGSNYARDSEECAADGFVCSPKCDSSSGCSGPNDTQCVMCAVGLFKLGKECTSTCSTDPGKFNDDVTRTCQPCHELCEGMCFGPAPTNCSNCSGLSIKTTVDQGFECVSSCPEKYYVGSQEECLPCFEGCTNCVGPQMIVNMANGCTSCERVILNNNQEQVMCLSNASACPDGYYPDQLASSTGILEEGAEVCLPCDEFCSTCIGPGVSNSSCLTCTYAVDEDGMCVDACQPGSVSQDPDPHQCVNFTSMPTDFPTPSDDVDHSDNPGVSASDSPGVSASDNPGVSASDNPGVSASDNVGLIVAVIVAALLLVLALVGIPLIIKITMIKMRKKGKQRMHNVPTTDSSSSVGTRQIEQPCHIHYEKPQTERDNQQRTLIQGNPVYVTTMDSQQLIALSNTPAYSTVYSDNQQLLLQDKPTCQAAYRIGSTSEPTDVERYYYS